MPVRPPSNAATNSIRPVLSDVLSNAQAWFLTSELVDNPNVPIRITSCKKYTASYTIDTRDSVTTQFLSYSESDLALVDSRLPEVLDTLLANFAGSTPGILLRETTRLWNNELQTLELDDIPVHYHPHFGHLTRDQRMINAMSSLDLVEQATSGGNTGIEPWRGHVTVACSTQAQTPSGTPFISAYFQEPCALTMRGMDRLVPSWKERYEAALFMGVPLREMSDFLLQKHVTLKVELPALDDASAEPGLQP